MRTLQPDPQQIDAIEIPLTHGAIALVSAEDFERISAYHWWLDHGYAAGRESKADGGAKIYMHRVVMGAVKGQYIDHQDGHKLNNTRPNLRFCNMSQNMANVPAKATTRPRHSKYKGVTLFHDKRNGWSSWKAQIMVNRKHVSLGYFATEEEAAAAYDRAAKERWGEFALPNGAANGS